jgi:hypothetical protein
MTAGKGVLPNCHFQLYKSTLHSAEPEKVLYFSSSFIQKVFVYDQWPELYDPVF